MDVTKEIQLGSIFHEPPVEVGGIPASRNRSAWRDLGLSAAMRH